jgi:Uma2 family endonuclease
MPATLDYHGIMARVQPESTLPKTQAEFAEWVEERQSFDTLNHYEFLNGRVVMNPPAGFPHGSSDSRVQGLLFNQVYPGKLGEVFGSSQGFELPSGDTVEPDAAFVSKVRWEAITPVPGKFLRVVPDLLVEILSRRTAKTDRTEKKDIYAHNGVREYWLLDPQKRTLTQFLLEGDRFDTGRTFTADERVVSPTLAGLSFCPADLFI